MNCKNCNEEIPKTDPGLCAIFGWCMPCIHSLIAHETQFRVRGDMVYMAMAYDKWRAKPDSAVGTMESIESGLRRAFRTGWEARTREAMPKGKRTSWCDLCGANDHETTDIILKGDIPARACPNVIQPGPEWYERNERFWGKGMEDLLEFQKGYSPAPMSPMAERFRNRNRPDYPGQFCHPLGYTAVQVENIFEVWFAGAGNKECGGAIKNSSAFQYLRAGFFAGFHRRADDANIFGAIWDNTQFSNPDMKHSKDGYIGMCPKCGARIKPLSDGSGDFEACYSCGFGLVEDRIRPQT